MAYEDQPAVTVPLGRNAIPPVESRLVKPDDDGQLTAEEFYALQSVVANVFARRPGAVNLTIRVTTRSADKPEDREVEVVATERKDGELRTVRDFYPIPGPWMDAAVDGKSAGPGAVTVYQRAVLDLAETLVPVRPGAERTVAILWLVDESPTDHDLTFIAAGRRMIEAGKVEGRLTREGPYTAADLMGEFAAPTG